MPKRRRTVGGEALGGGQWLGAAVLRLRREPSFSGAGRARPHRFVLGVLVVAVVVPVAPAPTAALGPGAQRVADLPSSLSGRTDPVVALTFDDGPDPVTTPQILEVLASRGAKATFFVLGALAARHPDLIRRIASEGHVVAGHTWNHARLPGMGEAAFRAEVLATNALLASLTGVPVRCVRPPEGVSDAATVARLATHGLTTMQWSIDPRDWLLPGAATIANRVIDGLHPGAVVVLHDRRTAHQTPVALVPMLDGIAARGYRPVPICGGGERGPARPEVIAFGPANPVPTGEVLVRGPVVSGVSTSANAGLRLATADGGVFALGEASFLGSAGSLPLRSPVVGLAATPSGDGYWHVAADGGVFAFGDARFLGSTGGLVLRSPVVGLAATPSGDGYWLVAADGGVFAFGDAPFLGSAADGGGRRVVGLAASPTGGYWLVAERPA